MSMRKSTTKRRGRQGQQGYALVLMMFFLALLVLSTVVAAPTVISNIQREKEKEMVWRGKQYTRGIRMYYMRMRRFPTSLEDLTTAKNNIRFMRQAYKDPMNTADGSWRLIYVGPNGVLIGSYTMQFLGAYGNTTQQGAPGVPQNSSPGGNSGFAGNNGFANSGFGNSAGGGFGNSGGFGSSNNGLGNSSSTTAAANAGQAGTSTSDPNDPNAQNGDAQSGQPQPLAPMDASNTIGGNIIGVGSKINKKSFLWYQKAKNYNRFEFIWDPSKDVAVGGASRGIGTPVQNMNGNPNGTTQPGVNTVQPPANQNQNNGTPITDPGTPLQVPPSQ
jgi:type II secretory pathway pseudopilin PulG